jgi:hypothetical protein
MKSDPFDVVTKYDSAVEPQQQQPDPTLEISVRRLKNLPDSLSADLAQGTVKAVRDQQMKWRELRIDGSTTGVLLSSTVLDGDIWLALRGDFAPDPDPPGLAVFYAEEITLLETKTPEELGEIHKVKLAFGPGSRVRQ